MFSRVLAVSLMLVASTAVADDIATMSLSGTATVQAEPDVAYISAAVVTKNMNAQTSLEANRKSMAKVYEVLENQGVARKDIQTSNFSFQKVYRRERVGSGESPNNYKQVFDGYQTSNNIRVTVCDLDTLGTIITALVDAGVTNMGGVTFGSTEQQAKLDEARKLAMEDALKKANIYADAGNFTLVAVRSVSEGSYGRARLAYQLAAAADMESAATPVSGGTLSFSMSVQVVWEIGPKPNKEETARIKQAKERAKVIVSGINDILSKEIEKQQ